VRLPEMPAVRHEYPGHGGRPHHDPFPGLAALADEVAAAYPGPLHLAGVSMGAMVAVHCAIRHPSRVRSLLLACTNAAADGPAMIARARAAEEDGMASVIGPTLARWFTPAVLGQRPECPAVAYAAKALAEIGPATFAGAWRAIARHDVRAELPRIGVPVTCVAGLSDAASPPDRVARIASAVPSARMRLLDGPHMLHLERPSEFSAELSAHLDWAAGAAS
jgi:3-oxoadipate enol-lactonase